MAGSLPTYRSFHSEPDGDVLITESHPEPSDRDGLKNGNESQRNHEELSRPVSLPEIIPPEAAEAFRKIGIDTPEKAAAVIAISASVSRNPFPSPDMLRAYDDYKSGTGAEVMEWIKDQTRHRQGLERDRTNGSERRLNTAQQNSLIIAILGVLVAAGTSFFSPLVASVIVVVAVGGPSAATIIARILDKITKKN